MTRVRLPGRRGWIGLGVLLVGALVGGHLLGSRPATAAPGPVAPCPGTPTCARVEVALAATPAAVVDAVHRTIGDVRGAAFVTRTATGALGTFSVGPFTDEVAVEVVAAPRGAALWVRSASRVGRSDLGVNARRADRIVAAVTEWLPPDARVE